MNKTKTDKQQVHFWMHKPGYEELRGRAQAQEMPVSGLLRKYVKRGMADDDFVERGGTIIYRSKDGKDRIVRR
jgi:hypothetical protein